MFETGFLHPLLSRPAHFFSAPGVAVNLCWTPRCFGIFHLLQVAFPRHPISILILAFLCAFLPLNLLFLILFLPLLHLVYLLFGSHGDHADHVSPRTASSGKSKQGILNNTTIIPKRPILQALLVPRVHTCTHAKRHTHTHANNRVGRGEQVHTFSLRQHQCTLWWEQKRNTGSHFDAKQQLQE